MADETKISPEEVSVQKPRPTKPDQAKFDAELEAARKEHAADMEKYVRLFALRLDRVPPATQSSMQSAD